jgi:pentatricopeptide repeat protein
MMKQKLRGQSTMELMLKLMERSIFELRLSEYQGPAAWLCEPNYYNPLLELWANASTNKRKKLTKAIKVLEKLRKFKLMVPTFRYNRDTIHIIMKTIIRQGPRSERPFVADYVLREIRKEALAENRPDLMPDSRLYDFVLMAWRRSKLPRAGGQMKELLQRMRDEDGVLPTARSYAILLRWHARHTNVHEMEEVLEEMRMNDIQHTTTSWSYAFRCFWNKDEIEKAVKALQLMIAEQPESTDEVGLIADCTQVLFQTWAEMISNAQTELETKELYLQQAEEIYVLLMYQNWLDIQEKSESPHLSGRKYTASMRHHVTHQSICIPLQYYQSQFAC